MVRERAMRVEDKASCAGYDEQQPKLAASHRNLTTHQFMKAHVENESKINGALYPVFVQLKLRQVLEGSDIKKALATVSGNIIRGKMDKEHEKLLKEQDQESKKTNRKLESTKSIGSAQPPKL
ncbi:MAG: hypothetical protein BYD32DRAFT_461198 [Podila humilis]|nr:MAG: hypothetical protein BYD32DRAFT_461198 [Podila humilis]